MSLSRCLLPRGTTGSAAPGGAAVGGRPIAQRAQLRGVAAEAGPESLPGADAGGTAIVDGRGSAPQLPGVAADGGGQGHGIDAGRTREAVGGDERGVGGGAIRDERLDQVKEDGADG